MLENKKQVSMDDFDFLEDEAEVLVGAVSIGKNEPRAEQGAPTSSAQSASQAQAGYSNTKPIEPVGGTPNAGPKQGPETSPLSQLDEEDEIPGVSFIKLGAKVSSLPIERFKASKAFQSRIAVLSTKSVLAVKMHFVKGIGGFLCFGEECCEIEGTPKVRYCLPVVVYDTDNTGTKIFSDNMKLKLLVLGEEDYSNLVTLQTVSGLPLNKIDLVVKCSDEQYQKCSYMHAGEATWRKNLEKAEMLAKEWKSVRSRAYLAIARRITPETYKAKKGIVDPNEQAQLANVSRSQVSLLDNLSDALDNKLDI